MALEQSESLNRFSPKFRKELETKVRSFGKSVRYKFSIENPNPDPEKKSGEFVWPFAYYLDPTTFSIVDPYEDRPTEQSLKRVGIMDGYREENTGMPPRPKFKKIKLEASLKGVLKLNLDNPEDFEKAMILELHPKHIGGQFADPNKQQIIKRVDEIALATANRDERSARSKARNVAENMSDKEIFDFADAMSWDSTEDMGILRDRVEALAESDPKFFNDLVESKSVEYKALVKQAIDKGVIAFDMAEYKMYWCGNMQTIVMLSPDGIKSENEKFADWLQLGGEKATTVHKKIKSLTGNSKEVPA